MAKSDNAVIAFLKSKPGQYLIATGLVGILGWYLYNKAKGDISKTLHEDLNPASNLNVVNRALSAAGEAVTGNSQFDFDEWVSRLGGKSAAEKRVSAMLAPTEKPLN